MGLSATDWERKALQLIDNYQYVNYKKSYDCLPLQSLLLHYSSAQQKTNEIALITRGPGNERLQKASPQKQ